jgi:hypothetical protein
LSGFRPFMMIFSKPRAPAFLSFVQRTGENVLISYYIISLFFI